MPNLNALHEKYAEKGLLIIGVSGESESQIQKVFVDELGAKYAFGTIKDSVKQAYGITAYPSFFVIAPDGTLHSKGHPNEQVIEELLEQVRLTPKLPDDSRYDALRSMWEKEQYEKLDKYLAKMLEQEKLDADMREVFVGQQEALKARAESALKRVARYGEGPDYFTSMQKLEQIADAWKGFAAEQKAGEEIARFKKDSTIKKEISAGEKLQKLLDKNPATSMVKARKRAEKLQKFAEKYDGTYAAQRARQLLEH